ncbi:DMT family transporter [Phytohalomonas tamaricis]|uniref:DMT family transporter n=1 Tax=Phytohalomonas tamaricis TaxID=2081032 RepID=UPI000D0AED1B|nr:DMT family transporter [Phytohalomonas tamaricis]
MTLIEGLLLILAVCAGILMPVQAGVNSTLAQYAGSSIWASLISFCVGSLALLIVFVCMRLPWPEVSSLREAPAWSWIGGAMGAFFVACSVMLAPRLGAGTMMATFLAGQLTASIVLDHIGWATFPQHSLSWGRIAGVILLFAGVYLIRRY